MTLNVNMTSSNVRKFKFCHRKLKFETLTHIDVFYKNLEFGVNRCTSGHVTRQNVHFTKIAFSQSVLKLETCGWYQKIDKINVHILVTISALIDPLHR